MLSGREGDSLKNINIPRALQELFINHIPTRTWDITIQGSATASLLLLTQHTYQLSIATKASAHSGTIPPMKDTLCHFGAFINPTSWVYISHKSNTDRAALAWVRCTVWCTCWLEWRCKLTEVQVQGRIFPINPDILPEAKNIWQHWKHTEIIHFICTCTFERDHSFINAILWVGLQLVKKTLQNFLQRMIPKLISCRMNTIVRRV